MAKYLRYAGEFLSRAGITWRVEILQEADEPFATVGVLNFEAEEPLVIEWKKTEKEALLTVKLIRDSLGKIIYDSKEGIERPLRKRDIVVLMRGIKNRGDVFYKVLMENNIPCFVDDNKGYFDTIEINCFMSLLQLVDNPRQDVPLLTVMRSEILGFEISELAYTEIPLGTQ